MSTASMTSASIARPIARAPSTGARRRSGVVVRAAAATAAAPGCTRVKIDELKSTCSNAIMGQGYDAEETRAIMDVLMYAQLRGNNQGIIKVTTNGLARAADAVPMKVDTETALSAHIDGGKQQGMLVLNKATEMALEKAKANGFGIAGTCNTSTSTGALGYYCKKIADEGLIAIAMAQSPEFVAPTGSKQAIFGTNPIGVGIPSKRGSMVLDMATSAYSWFGLLEARTAGRSIPEGAAQDKNGVMTTDPNEALEGGAIRPFDGGYKSSNLSLVVELLSGPLVGAAINNKLSTKNWGNLIFAIDPKLLGNANFEEEAAFVLNRVKNAEKQPGVNEIYLPGERGDAIAAKNEAAGEIDVESNLWNNLKKLSDEFKAK
jgi:LDH2 family malate/lactate/ureidoglycolate dehydrogenase|mmetsp:Transcript_9418/g.21245  ORF Transcript_9418/g.21245 Transcript_9418/m.21245 type:complete len:376 (-) Transcript_9418:183-1310(-)